MEMLTPSFGQIGLDVRDENAVNIRPSSRKQQMRKGHSAVRHGSGKPMRKAFGKPIKSERQAFGDITNGKPHKRKVPERKLTHKRVRTIKAEANVIASGVLDVEYMPPPLPSFDDGFGGETGDVHIDLDALLNPNNFLEEGGVSTPARRQHSAWMMAYSPMPQKALAAALTPLKLVGPAYMNEEAFDLGVGLDVDIQVMDGTE